MCDNKSNKNCTMYLTFFIWGGFKNLSQLVLFSYKIILKKKEVQ